MSVLGQLIPRNENSHQIFIRWLLRTENTSSSVAEELHTAKIRQDMLVARGEVKIQIEGLTGRSTD